AYPGAVRFFAKGVPADGWRTFEVITRVEVLKPVGVTRIWVPGALIGSAPFQRTLSNSFSADQGGTAKLVEDSANSLAIVSAEFREGVKPGLTVTSRVATKDIAVDLGQRGSKARANREELQRFLQPTKLIPVDGIVKSTAQEITKGTKTDVEKARVIYGWIVD